MSNLKYKSNNPSTASTTANLPIWCSLSTPSQIARKYASIAPIWCHISRPRQLKKKFASTLHQAQSLLTRQHSKDTTANTTTTSNTNSSNNNISSKDREDGSGSDVDDAEEERDELNNYKTPVSTANLTNIPASASKTKILTSSTNDYDLQNDLYDSTQRAQQFLKKRDNSLDIKRDNLVPSSTSSNYLFNTNTTPSASSSNTLTNSNKTGDSVGSRWNTSVNSSANMNGTNGAATNKSLKSQYTVNGKDNYDSGFTSLVTALYDDNLGTSSSLHAADSAISSTRRPNKYMSSKYGDKFGGSKTEKILSKPSKSSPNLLTKDYDHLYTDKYDQQKWHSGNYSSSSSSSNHPYHSNVNPYNTYSSNYSNFQPSTNANPSESSYYNSTNTANTTREDKWNELDSMLGAQSALLSRLESDFVANRSKLKTNPSLNSISAANSNSNTSSSSSAAAAAVSSNQMKTATLTQPYQAGGLLAKYTQLANQSKPSLDTTEFTGLYSQKHKTPNHFLSTTNSSSTFTNLNSSSNHHLPTTHTTTTTTTNLNLNNLNKKYFIKNDLGKYEEEQLDKENNSNNGTLSKYSSKKTEPIIDLIRCLELNDEKQRKAEELENANLAASINKNLTIETTINLKNYNNQPTTDENIDDFVDEFINDYFNNTLKSDTYNNNNNSNNTTTNNNNNINSTTNNTTTNTNSINNYNNNQNSNSINCNNKSNTNSNSSSKTNSNNNISNLIINNNNNVINTVNSLNEINNNNNNNNHNSNITNNNHNTATTTTTSSSNYNLSNTINSDNYNQNWFVSITFKYIFFCFVIFKRA